MSDLVIRPLTPGLHDDQLRFFDLVAFADDPHWERCFCSYYLRGRREDWDASTKEENRAMRSALIRSGRGYGLLAYRLGRVVGWCHAAPKAVLPLLRPDPERDRHVGAIVCFIVAPDARHQGVATRLLDAACDYLQEIGMRVAEAYPQVQGPDDPMRWPAVNSHGPLSMFERAGFDVVERTNGQAVVRKRLAADDERHDAEDGM